jgi:hypothetical protein
VKTLLNIGFLVLAVFFIFGLMAVADEIFRRMQSKR